MIARPSSNECVSGGDNTHCPNVEAQRDTGSVAVVVLTTALVWMLAMTVALGPIVRHLADRQHAQSAADAAALGAVLHDCAVAGRLAASNKASLVSCERTPAPGGVGIIARVVVEVGTVSATARASNGP